MILREKLLAFAIHFVVTLALACGAAALIFLVWFPDPFHEMLGGTKLFWLVVGCDLALGPLISLVIYNSRKSRKELIFDYTLVGAVQIAALVYGVWVVSSSRPTYVAFVQDRLEVITAAEIDDADLAAGREPFDHKPWLGPTLVSTQVPKAEQSDVMFSALEGKDVSVLPKYYVSYESELPQIKARSADLNELERKHPQSKPLVADALQNIERARDTVRWLPVKHKRGFWTALVDAQNGQPLAYFDLDPY